MCQLVSVCVSPALKCLVSINKRGNGRPQNSQTHGRHTPLMTSASRQETALCNKSKMVLLRPDAVVTALLRLCSFFDFCTVVVVAIPISPLLYLHNLHVTSKHHESLILTTEQSDVLDFSHLQILILRTWAAIPEQFGLVYFMWTLYRIESIQRSAASVIAVSERSLCSG